MDITPPIKNHAFEVIPDAESLILEDRLWWINGRKAIIRKYLECARKYGAISTIMDIGCGSGGNLDVLGDFGKVIGVEPSETLACRARSRGIAEAIFQQDALEISKNYNVQLFTMFDVLEHIETDKAFLAQLRNKAAQTHHLLVSVPACQFLYCNHDRILHHHRRYSNKTLRATLEAGGYQVLQMSYFMFILFPFAFLSRMKDRLFSKSGQKRTSVGVSDIPSILSFLLSGTLKIEAFISKIIRFPIGLWLFALAKSEGHR